MGKSMNDNDVSRFVTFDPEEIVTREVFARFGRAFYCANVLERGVLMALVRAEWRRNLRPPMTREEYQTQYDAFYGKWEKKSLGQVVERLFLQPDITDELRRLLVKAVSARNTLAHHYFWL